MAQLRRPFQEELSESEIPSTTPQYDPFISSESPSLRSVTKVVQTDRVVKENDGDGAKVTEQVVTQYTSTVVGGENVDEDDADRLLDQEDPGYYAAPFQEVPVIVPPPANTAAYDYGNQAYYAGGVYYADQPPVPGFEGNQAYASPFFGRDQQAGECYPCGDEAPPTGRPAP